MAATAESAADSSIFQVPCPTAATRRRVGPNVLPPSADRYHLAGIRVTDDYLTVEEAQEKESVRAIKTKVLYAWRKIRRYRSSQISMFLVPPLARYWPLRETAR